MDKKVKEILNELVEGLHHDKYHFMIVVGREGKDEKIETFFGLGGTEYDMINDLIAFIEESPDVEKILKRAVALHALEKIHANLFHEDQRAKGKIN